MATTDLHLNEPGSLLRSGPVGRLTRLAFGLACMSYLVGALQISGNLMDTDAHIKPIVWNGMLIGLFLISYIINIGYSMDWKKWPAIVSAAAFAVIAAFGFLSEGAIETNIFARVVWVWEIYLFSHLGLAFVISALIGTPGCEMRAFHDLYSRITGIPTKEHQCPIGPLRPIDLWEAKQVWMQR